MSAPVAYPVEFAAVYQAIETPARRPPLTSIARARPSVPRLPNAKPWSTLSAATTSGCPAANAKPLVDAAKATHASANCHFTRSA
jgi:hypothetical protein